MYFLYVIIYDWFLGKDSLCFAQWYDINVRVYKNEVIVGKVNSR